MKIDFPYMPLYYKDWLTGQATTAMTLEQEGAFLNLLLRAWSADPPCTLPNDPARLAQMSKLGPRWKKVGAIVLEQFEAVDDGTRLRNPKQFKVYCEQLELREKRSLSGRKGNEKRWGSQRNNPENGSHSDRNDDREGIAKRSQSDRKPTREAVAKPSPASADANAVRDDDDDADASSHLVDLPFERFWQAYPKRHGSNPKRDALQAWNARIREGVNPEDIVAGLSRYVRHLEARNAIGTEFVMQAKRFVGPSEPFRESWDGALREPHDRARPQSFDYSNTTTTLPRGLDD